MGETKYVFVCMIEVSCPGKGEIILRNNIVCTTAGPKVFHLTLWNCPVLVNPSIA